MLKVISNFQQRLLAVLTLVNAVQIVTEAVCFYVQWQKSLPCSSNKILS